MDIFVAWCELISEQREDGKINFICSMCISGMHFRLAVGHVVEQNIEHRKPEASVAFCIMAFRVICTNNFGIDRDMVGYQGIGNDSLLQPEIFGSMAGIDGMDASFKLLSVTTGMQGVTDIIIPKDR